MFISCVYSDTVTIAVKIPLRRISTDEAFVARRISGNKVFIAIAFEAIHHSESKNLSEQLSIFITTAAAPPEMMI